MNSQDCAPHDHHPEATMLCRNAILPLAGCLLTLACHLVPGGRLSAHEDAAALPCPAVTFEGLSRMSWPDLERVYRAAAPGSLPCGYAIGRAIYDPCDRRSETRNRLTAAVWHGKHFLADGTLVNQWAGFKAIRARVFYGPSWLDGGPAIVMDYGETSRVWADVRDEAREIAPGLYLGLMYQRRCPRPALKTFFVLQAPPARIVALEPGRCRLQLVD